MACSVNPNSALIPIYALHYGKAELKNITCNSLSNMNPIYLVLVAMNGQTMVFFFYPINIL